MCYASKSIDRRAAYYARCAELIAEDPLGFYTRAERGRRYIESHRVTFVAPPSPTLASLFAKATLAAQAQAAQDAAREHAGRVREYAYLPGRGLAGHDED
jgi:hypothetical protein